MNGDDPSLRDDCVTAVAEIASYLGDEHLSRLLGVAADLWEKDPAPRMSVAEIVDRRRHLPHAGHGRDRLDRGAG